MASKAAEADFKSSGVTAVGHGVKVGMLLLLEVATIRAAGLNPAVAAVLSVFGICSTSGCCCCL